MYRLEITLMGLPSTPNARRHFHVVAKENAVWYAAVKASVGMNKPEKPLESAKLTLTRMSTTEPDYDNLAASFKPLLDGLRYAGVITDDKKKNIGRPEYRWEHAAPRKGCVKIIVEEIVNG